jgi:hypothetical protein
MYDRDKVRVALGLAPLRSSRLCSGPDRLGEPRCYCGIGNLLLGAGVPDGPMIVFDGAFGTTLDRNEYVLKVIEYWGDALSGAYSFVGDDLYPALYAVMRAVDIVGLVDAVSIEAFMFRQVQEGSYRL